LKLNLGKKVLTPLIPKAPKKVDVVVMEVEKIGEVEKNIKDVVEKEIEHGVVENESDHGVVENERKKKNRGRKKQEIDRCRFDLEEVQEPIVEGWR